MPTAKTSEIRKPVPITGTFNQPTATKINNQQRSNVQKRAKGYGLTDLVKAISGATPSTSRAGKK